MTLKTDPHTQPLTSSPAAPMVRPPDLPSVPKSVPETTKPRLDRPQGLPDKFWDPVRQTVDVAKLWKSYRELERRFSAGDGGLIPDTAEDYCLDCGDRQPDAEVNAILHAAGFTNDQAQLVYNLAQQYVVPELERRDTQVHAEKVKGRLEQHFGGPERWAETAKQLDAWGRSNLAPDVFETMGASFEGVLALHRMMASDEPGVAARDGTGPEDLNEAALRKLMQDPKYWRDHDPALTGKVRAGFQRLYPG